MLEFALLVGIVTPLVIIALFVASLFQAQRLAFAAWIGYLAIVLAAADVIVWLYAGDLLYLFLAGLWTFIGWMNLKRAGRI